MAIFGSKGYDRTRILGDAARALKKGRLGKALELYERVLHHEPNNADLRRRTAPLLAASGRTEDALVSYRIAAASLVQRGFFDHAVGVYREAAQRLPRQREVWEQLADLHMRRGKPADAHRDLLAGARHLRGRRERTDAIALLIRARKLEPRHPETCFELARALARDGAKRHAASVLSEMATWTRGSTRRRVRLRQLRLALLRF